MKSEFKAKLIQHLLSRKDSEKGFTLIELLVVVVIIGILSAIALPTFLTQVNNARQAEARNFVSAAGRAVQAYFVERNIFPPSAGPIGAGNAECTGGAVGGFAATDINRPGMFAAGGFDVCLRFYDVTFEPSAGAGAATASIENFRGASWATPRRNTLRGYANTVWAAQFPGSPLPEVFTVNAEQSKAGNVGEVKTYAQASFDPKNTPITAASFEPSSINANWFRLGK